MPLQEKPLVTIHSHVIKPQVIMLAAGLSSRFGSHKLMHIMADQRPMILHSLAPYIKADLPITVVCNQRHKQLHQLLDSLNIHYVIAQNADKGMGHSIAEGITNVLDENNTETSSQGWMIALADLPFLKNKSVITLLNKISEMRSNNSDNPLITRLSHNKKPGHPVYFSQYFKNDLINLTGDIGAKKIMDNDFLAFADVEDAGCRRDIDRPDQFNK
jgi:molybdenum cofactor cytidylyltransferase